MGADFLIAGGTIACLLPLIMLRKAALCVSWRLLSPMKGVASPNFRDGPFDPRWTF